jgi:hypothetical protein
MSSQTVRSGFDGWVSSGYPNVSHPQEIGLKVRSGIAYAYLWLRSPVPRGATVVSATLTLRARGASSGSRTLSVRRATSSWKASRLNYNNRPGVGPSSATKVIGTVATQDRIEFDVTDFVQAWANGLENYGWRIDTTASATHELYGFNSAYAPTLSVTWADNPSEPTDLRPSEAVTSKAKPHLTFTYNDVSGNTELAAVRVQINPTNSFSSPAFDSGEVATTASGLDLATTAYAGLAEDASAYWRVRAKDGAGLWSTWSDPVQMTRKSKPTVTIENLGAGVAYDSSPPIIWSVSGGTQTRFRVIVSHVTDGRIVYDSKEHESAETSHTIPAGYLFDDWTYRVRVRVWDGENREATPGDPTYAEAEANFHLDTDVDVGGVTGLAVAQVGLKPTVDLTWNRSTTPDRFVILRDGRQVAMKDAEDLYEGGTSYRYRSYGSRPNWSHRWEVRAVVNGRTSPSSDGVFFTTRVEGLWILDSERDIDVTLYGDDEGTWKMEDDASVYTPVGSDQVVRVVSGLRGLEGSLSGALMAGFGKTFRDMEADLYRIKERPYRPVRIVAGDMSFQALIGNITIAPSPKTRAGQIYKDVSFDFWQVEQREFEAVL